MRRGQRGHPVSFEIDVARLPDARLPLGEVLAEVVEETARELSDEASASPAAFALSIPQFDRIVCRYGLADARGSLDASRREIVLTGSVTQSLLPPHALTDVFDHAYSADLTRRFASVEPEAVAAADRATYFTWLRYERCIETAGERIVARAHGAEPRSPSCGPETIESGIRLANMTSASRDPDQASLATAERKWLLRFASDYASAYANDAAVAQPLPASAPWHRAEAAWSAWLSGVAPSLTDAEAGEVAGSVFSSYAMKPRDGEGQTPFPGFDPFAFGLMVVDRWVRAGHPTERGAYYTDVVCPVRVERDNPRGRSAWRFSDFYLYALATERNTLRLAQALIARHDPILTRAVFGTVGARLPLWRGVEGDTATWHAATVEVVSAVLSDEEEDGQALPELERMLDRHPDRKSALLRDVCARCRPPPCEWRGWRTAPAWIKSACRAPGGSG